MIAIGIILIIIMFFIMCVLSKIATELEKARIENRKIINVIDKELKNEV